MNFGIINDNINILIKSINRITIKNWYVISDLSKKCNWDPVKNSGIPIIKNENANNLINPCLVDDKDV